MQVELEEERVEFVLLDWGKVELLPNRVQVEESRRRKVFSLQQTLTHPHKCGKEREEAREEKRIGVGVTVEIALSIHFSFSHFSLHYVALLRELEVFGKEQEEFLEENGKCFVPAKPF